MRQSWLLFTFALGALVASIPWAVADEPARAPASPDLLCRVFPQDLGRSDVLDTADRTSQVGQWVGSHRDAGLEIAHLDFEVGQKATAFAQGWVQVCMGHSAAL